MSQCTWFSSAEIVQFQRKNLNSTLETSPTVRTFIKFHFIQSRRVREKDWNETVKDPPKLENPPTTLIEPKRRALRIASKGGLLAVQSPFGRHSRKGTYPHLHPHKTSYLHTVMLREIRLFPNPHIKINLFGLTPSTHRLITTNCSAAGGPRADGLTTFAGPRVGQRCQTDVFLVF